MTISAIVPAAGCGARAALNGNKILAPLRGKTLLGWTLEALRAAPYEVLGCELVETIVVARDDEFPLIERVRYETTTPLDFWLTPGGQTRQDSVYNGVCQARGSLILVHDAARPCVSGELLVRTIEAALQTGAAIAAVPVSDTVKHAMLCASQSNHSGSDSTWPRVAQTLNREEIWLAQTPQVFRRDWLMEALKNARDEGFQGTDCSSLLEKMGRSVALVSGEIDNLKVTYGPDLERASSVLAARGSISL